jgi:hypothetical protein
MIPGDGQIWVEWGTIASASSYEVWYYEIASGAGTAQKAPEITSDPLALSHSQTIDGLTNTVEYTVYVKAKSEHDWRDSAEQRATPRTLPAKPLITALTPGIGQITVNWDQVPTAAAYEILYSTANNFSEAKKYGEILDPGTSVVIRGLAQNTAYFVWLRAKNDQGSSRPSDPVSGTTLASGGITVALNRGSITISDGDGNDLSRGFTLAATGSVTLSADGSFTDVKWHVDGSLLTGNTLTLNGSSYSANRDHSVTFSGKVNGVLYSSDPISFQIK